MNLEEATRVEGSDGVYHANLSRDWEIWGPNGGYLAAIALRAASMLAEIRRPSSLYCHFLSSPQFEPVDLRVNVLKRGRRAESFSVRMEQGGKPMLEALVRTASEAPGYEQQHIAAPSVPVPEQLRSGSELWKSSGGPRYRFWENLEARPIDQRTNWDKEPRAPVRRDWIRYQPQACFDDLFVDAARSLILLDTYGWPATWYAHPDGLYTAPNLDTSVWFHRFSNRSEWLLIDHACAVAAAGLIGVNGRVWDREGNLVATGSAHLCCLPTPQVSN